MLVITELVGRVKERAKLEAAMQSEVAELVAVLGRRRVGKTFLVDKVCGEQMVFKITGSQGIGKKQELKNFAFRLSRFANQKVPVQKDWFDAFVQLIDFLESKEWDFKPIVFFDELPWLATARSGFLNAFNFFWNSWAVNRNIMVVLCGSAASWMIQKVINHRGGLYNRLTRRIQLNPFTLYEVEQFLAAAHSTLNHYQIVQLYMVLGGIPHYWMQVDINKSAIQNIDAICFAEEGMLRNEFKELYPALFDDAERHIAVIRALASKKRGMTRNEIIKLAKVPEGGTIKRILEELRYSGFISAYYPFGKKKKNILYRLTDEYSLFYLQFIENKLHQGAGDWEKYSLSQTYKTWSGYAFESICLKHVSQIKTAMSIAGMYSEAVSYFKKPDALAPGVQIDLLLDRRDGVINIFEIKFYNGPFVMTKKHEMELRTKVSIFQAATQTRKQVFIGMITTFGVQPNAHSLGLVNVDLTLTDLFVA